MTFFTFFCLSKSDDTYRKHGVGFNAAVGYIADIANLLKALRNRDIILVSDLVYKCRRICFPFIYLFLDTVIIFRRRISLCHCLTSIYNTLIYDALKMTLMLL